MRKRFTNIKCMFNLYSFVYGASCLFIYADHYNT